MSYEKKMEGGKHMAGEYNSNIDVNDIIARLTELCYDDSPEAYREAKKLFDKLPENNAE